MASNRLTFPANVNKTQKYKLWKAHTSKEVNYEQWWGFLHSPLFGSSIVSTKSIILQKAWQFQNNVDRCVVCYRDHFRISDWGQWSRGFNFVTKYLAVVKNGKLLNYSISFYCKNSNRNYQELDACMSYLSGGLVLICLISSWSSLSVLWRFVSSLDMFWPLSAKAGWLTCSILICFWINT